MQMDVCSHIGLSVTDVSSLHGFCSDTPKSTYGPAGDFLVDELAYGATETLNIQVDVEQNSISIPQEKEDVIQIKAECSQEHQSEIITKAHEKVDAAIINEVITHDDSAKSVHPHCSSAQSQPESLKLVSAMKGSREKHGLSVPEQLTVKWAPDVYDPVPTPSLHMVINRPRKHGKNKSKSKKKNMSKSRGSKSKDEKQAGKDMGFKLCEHKEEVTCVSEIQQLSDIDFLPEVPDIFCEGSFVSSHDSSLHLSSVTEAT